MTVTYVVTFEFETKPPLNPSRGSVRVWNAHIGGTGGENSRAGGRPTDVVVGRHRDRACDAVLRGGEPAAADDDDIDFASGANAAEGGHR